MRATFVEARCTGTHPKLGGTCGELLFRWRADARGMIEQRCSRCKRIELVILGSSMIGSSS